MSFLAYFHLLVAKAASPAWAASFGVAGPIAAAVFHVAVQKDGRLVAWERFVNGQLIIGAWAVVGFYFLIRSAWLLHSEQIALTDLYQGQLADRRHYGELAEELRKEYADAVHRLANQMPMDLGAHEAWLQDKLQWERSLRERMMSLDCPIADVSHVWDFPIDNLSRRANNPMLLHKDMLTERLTRLKSIIDAYRTKAEQLGPR